MKGVLSKRKTVITENQESGVRTYEQTETNYSKKSSEDAFFFVFPSGSKFIQTCTSSATIKVAFYPIINSELNTGDIKITDGAKTEILNLCHITKQTYYSAIKELIEVGVMLQKYIVNKRTGEELLKKGEYLLNPYMFWRGDKSARRKVIERITIENTDSFQEDLSEQK